jgi:hypothetical protein
MFGVAVPDAEAGRKRKRYRHRHHQHSYSHHYNGYSGYRHYCAPVHHCGHCGVVYRGYHDCCHGSRSYGSVYLNGGGLQFSYGRGW